MVVLQSEDPNDFEAFGDTEPESRRVPLEKRVVLRFNDFGGFFVENSANVSLTGLFIKTETPMDPGSVFIFEIWLGKQYRLVHGLGEVIWTRPTMEGPDRPAGMGIRFLKMDAQSRATIAQAIADCLAYGRVADETSAEADYDPQAVFHTESGAEPLPEAASFQEEAADEAMAESEPTGSELLSLDAEDLKLGQPLETGGLRTRRLDSRKRRSGLRLAAVVLLLAAVLGSLAYLAGADLLPF